MMKYLTLLTLAGLLFSFSVNKPKKFTPPGTVQITESLFADETEISNFSWREYEFWVKTKYGAGSKEHLAVLPDTLVWRQDNATNEAYVKHYYRHIAYKDYPVVGISHSQAQAFCNWRTERVKEYYMIRYKKELHIEYRLPSKQEWELLSNNGANVFSNKGWDEKGYFKLNCARNTHDSSAAVANETTDVTAPIYSYWSNSFGLFNTIGNVSEMILEPGISKGGSWRHDLEECRSGKDIFYTKAEAWLGFRCVCLVKEAS